LHELLFSPGAIDRSVVTPPERNLARWQNGVAIRNGHPAGTIVKYYSTKMLL